jgi:hypothetical protein
MSLFFPNFLLQLHPLIGLEVCTGYVRSGPGLAHCLKQKLLSVFRLKMREQGKNVFLKSSLIVATPLEVTPTDLYPKWRKILHSINQRQRNIFM